MLVKWIKNKLSRSNKAENTEETEQVEMLLKSNDAQIPDYLQKGSTDLLHLVLPDGCDFSERDIGFIQDGIGKERVVQPIYITRSGYPRKLKTTCFYPLIHASNTDVVFHFDKFKRKDAIRALQKKATILRSNLNLELKRGNNDQIFDLEIKIKDTELLMSEIQIGLNDQFYVSVNANIYAETEDHLESKQSELLDWLAGDNFNARPAYARVKQGYLSALPLGKNRISEGWRNLDRYATASLFPFATNELRYSGPKAIPWGINKMTGNFVFYDPFSKNNSNYNLGIYGISGAGKSFAVKLLAARGLIEAVATVFIDPEGEYRTLVRQLGGVYVSLVEERISNKPQITINPCSLWPSVLQLDGEDDDEVNHINEENCEVYQDNEGRTFVRFVAINEKINEILAFIEMIVKDGEKSGLNAYERDFIEQAIVKVFNQRGFNEHPSSLYEEAFVDGDTLKLGRVRKKEVTISDIYTQLIADFGNLPEAQTLLVSIRPYLRSRIEKDNVTGDDVEIRGSKGMFDGQSYFGDEINSALEENLLVGFDLSALESNERLQAIAYHVVFNWVWEKFVKGNPLQAKRILTDEAWKFVDNEQAVNFLEKAARRARKRNCSLTIASQDFIRLVKNEKAAGVVSNCHTVFFMKQDEEGAEQIKTTFRLSEGETSKLLGDPPPGEGILRIGGESVWMATLAADEELYFLESNLAHKEQLRKTGSA